jgi:DNA-binding transcriptional LysR family regulator
MARTNRVIAGTFVPAFVGERLPVRPERRCFAPSRRRAVSMASHGTPTPALFSRSASWNASSDSGSRRAGRGESGLLRLDYMNTRMYDYLIPVIRQFREEFPGVSVDFQNHFVAGRHAALMQGRLDIGISILPTPEAWLNSKPLVEAAPVVAIAARDPLAVRGTVEWSELVGRLQIMLPSGSASEFQKRTQAMLREHGLELPIAQVADEDRALYTLVGMGMGMGIGIAIVPFYARDQPTDVVFLRFPDDAPRFVYGVVWPAAIENVLRDRFIELVPLLILAE